MGDVINLRKARKQAKRDHEAQQAVANRLLRGRSKSERKLADARGAKTRRDLDQHQVETGDER